MTDIASLGIVVTQSGVKESEDGLNKMADAGDRASASTDKLSKATANAAKAYNSASYRQQTADLAKLVGQIDPTVAALDKLDQQQAKLAAFKKSGILSADDFKTYSAAIDASRSKIAGASDALEHFSLNNANARRELGYLAKDIATGQWGRLEQSFATLVSQSGLLAVVFSTAGLAIAGLAVAVGVAGVAFVQAQNETSAYNKALIETGANAGVTAAQLNDMAKAMTSTIGTQHQAAEALAQVTAAGKFTGDQIQTVATAAEQLQQATGQSIKDTIKQFSDLADDPVKAIIKLNNEQHFLTDAVYEQIKALEDQGRAQDAANLAEDTYANAIGDRSTKIKANLGTIETAWNSVKSAAANAWDAMLSVGRDPTGDDKLLQLQGQANALAKQLQALKDAPAPGGSGFGNIGSVQRDQEIQSLQARLDAAVKAYHDEEHKQSDDGVGAAKAAALQSANEIAIALGQEADQYASAEDKRAKAIAAAHQKANDAIAKLNATSDATLIAQIRDNEAKVVAGINSQGPKAKDDSIDADLLVQKQVTEEITKQIEGYKKELTQQALNTTAINNYKAAQEDKLKTDQAAIDLQVQAVSLGKQQVQIQQQLIKAQSDADKQIEQLNRDFADKSKGMTQETYDAQLAAITDFENKRKAQIVKGNNDILAAQADWKNGMVGAIADYEESAANVAGQTRNLFTNAFDGIGDALANFVTTGKLNFTDLANSIVSDLVKIETRILVSQALQSLFGSYTPGTDASAMAGINAQIGRNTAGINWSPTANANGGVYASDSLSHYSGQVISKPTLFAFAKGAGLMGEAGPEAIMPLTRGANGKLGVQSSGGGAQVEVNITNQGQPVQAQQTGVRQDGGKTIVDMIINTVAQDTLRGGKTAKAQEQRYGLRQKGNSVGSAQ